jgi:hypothetical protein
MISNACRELTSHLTAPNEEHWKALTHLVGYLKSGSFQGIKLRVPEDFKVVAYVDADNASDRNDRKSISGFLVTIGGCLVSWLSKKQTGVTLSSTESEFVAMSMVATEVKFIVSLLTEIMGVHRSVHDGHVRGGASGPMLPSILQEDNTGAIFMAENTAIGLRTKHVDVRYRFVNDMVLAKELSVEHIRSGENPSDCMTKNLPLALFGKHAALICDGRLARLHEPTNTEDVRSYCATVGKIDGATVRCDDSVDGDGATVLRDTTASTKAICSIGLCSSYVMDDDDLGWTVVNRDSNKSKTKT